MMKTVKCFKRDEWVDTNVFDMDSGDIFAHQGQTYVATAKPYMSDGKPNIPAELYDSGPIILNFDRSRDYISMAMDYVCSPAHEFGDGTMQICDFEGGNTNVYSPRLPIAELNDFCKAHMEHYEAFFDKYEKRLDSGDVIEMPKFW
ncbi:hypothetical protein Q9888_002712 [Vibrio cholerae]|nr:hypothetical protein [Vibrio cholerae]